MIGFYAIKNEKLSFIETKTTSEIEIVADRLQKSKEIKKWANIKGRRLSLEQEDTLDELTLDSYISVRVELNGFNRFCKEKDYHLYNKIFNTNITRQEF